MIDNTKQVGDGATCATKDSRSALSATDSEHLPSQVLLGEKRRRSPSLHRGFQNRRSWKYAGGPERNPQDLFCTEKASMSQSH